MTKYGHYSSYGFRDTAHKIVEIQCHTKIARARKFDLAGVMIEGGVS